MTDHDGRPCGRKKSRLSDWGDEGKDKVKREKEDRKQKRGKREKGSRRTKYKTKEGYKNTE